MFQNQTLTLQHFVVKEGSLCHACLIASSTATHHRDKFFPSAQSVHHASRVVFAAERRGSN